MKKFIKTISILFIVFSCLLVSPTFAKYSNHYYGCAWLTNFTDFPIIGEIFVVESEDIYNEDGTLKSQIKGPHVWGRDQDGNLDGFSQLGGDYTMNKLKNVSFSVYNDSDQDMRVLFSLTFYIVEVLTKFNFYVANTQIHDEYTTPADDTISPYETVSGSFLNSNRNLNKVETGYMDGEIYRASVVQGNDNVNMVLVRYYQYFGTIDPYIQLGDSELFKNEYVVPKKGGYQTYHLRVDFSEQLMGNNSLLSCYATTNIVLLPYNQ